MFLTVLLLILLFHFRHPFQHHLDKIFYLPSNKSLKAEALVFCVRERRFIVRTSLFILPFDMRPIPQRCFHTRAVAIMSVSVCGGFNAGGVTGR